MKILFLDCDGVLNSHAEPGFLTLSDARLRRLRHIVQETDCKIVVSSSWRKMDDSRKRLVNKLRYKKMSVHDWTTTEFFHVRTEEEPSQLRGHEIKKWLDEHPGWTTYCILDDDSDMLSEQMPFFVKTDGYVGLTDEDANRAIGILNRQKDIDNV